MDNYIHILREDNPIRFNSLVETAEESGLETTGDGENLIFYGLSDSQQETLASGLTSEGIAFHRISL